jgi:hypothetical protein
MATRDQVRDAIHQQPFLGFTVRLTDGRSFHIRHPDFISIPTTERRRNVAVHDDGGMHLIDLLHIVEVTVPEAGDAATPPATSPAEGNGA